MYYGVLQMTVEHPFHVETDGWQHANELLDGTEDEPVVGLLSMDEGVIVNGKEEKVKEQNFYLGPAEKINGSYLVLPQPLSEEIYGAHPELASIMNPEERNTAGFFTGHAEGYNVEVKYDEEIPDSEDWHAHAGFEAYAPQDGSIDLGISQDENIDEVLHETVSEGEVVVVSPFVQHKVIDQQNNPDLAVVRYNTDFQKIPKYDAAGELDYSWSENPPDYSFEPGKPGETVKRVQ